MVAAFAREGGYGAPASVIQSDLRILITRSSFPMRNCCSRRGFIAPGPIWF